MKITETTFYILALLPYVAVALNPSLERGVIQVHHSPRSFSLEASRRDFVESMTRAAVLSASTVTVALHLPLQPALASGGATAGGAYLLSAKQRYNDRVKGGVKGHTS